MPRPPPDSALFDLTAPPDAGVYDGRFSSNAWLQELPRPITKLTWTNAAFVAPATAGRLGLATGDTIELSRGLHTLTAGVMVLTGQAENTFTLSAGFGRRSTDSLAEGLGSDAFALRTSELMHYAGDVSIKKLDAPARSLPLMQLHHETAGRPVAPVATREQWKENPELTEPLKRSLPTLLSSYPALGDQWAMTIDTSICTGCSACVLGCQSENNIPVVGPQRGRARAYHALATDRHLRERTSRGPDRVHQPMACQHCEKAPCEYVCPVNATVHSPDGLNEMVYNRCVGTRFCSNNCPYKVRRFNWFDWNEHQPMNQGTPRLQRNPNVTVRQRGVMEKCTYCVQRIRTAEITARNERRAIAPGEVVTACQQACPTQAIQFGSLRHTETKMVAWRAESRSLWRAPRAGHQPADSLSSADQEPQPRVLALIDAPIYRGKATDAELTDQLLAPVYSPRSRWWWVAFAVSSIGVLLLTAAIFRTVGDGIGTWGNNIPVGWALGIVHFVFWIGIGHAGTFISAVLLLFEQSWRTSINRFAEAMTLFAVIQAGLFPLLHLGRPWFFYWLVPYPSTMQVWPQFRSALPWDAAAVFTYFTVSLLFWYLGLLPDLAALRDHAPGRGRRLAYGVLALGFRGSVRHYRHYRVLYGLLAGIATPLVLSVHSIVSSDFAITLVPGWHSTIFPPFFVAGAIFSGFAMVATLLIPARRIFELDDVVTERHLDNLGKMILMTGWIVIYSYIIEDFIAWYSGSPYEWYQYFRGSPVRREQRRLLDADVLQRRHAAVLVVASSPRQPWRPLRSVDLREHRYVGRAVRDHRHVAGA